MAFLTRLQLEAMGFAALGSNVLISDKASIYNPGHIRIGSHVRIDDFCIISAGADGIDMGSYIHISCYASLIGKAKITLGDYVGISSRTSVYSSSDDYSGQVLVGPMVPESMRNVDNRPVLLHDYALVGAQCVILPGVTIGEGTAVGAISLVSKSLDPWGIYVGAPLKFIKPRRKNLLELAAELNQRITE